MTVEEAVLQVQREAGRLRATRRVLEQVLAAIAAPSPEELAAMANGERPLSAEAHLLGILQAATAQLENVENDLRLNVSAWDLSRLERSWRRGELPDRQELQWIRSALNERNAKEGSST
jgi:hypothetical protein